MHVQVEFILLVLSLLFFVSILTDKLGNRLGVPALLLFLAVGMLFGPDGIGTWFGTQEIGYMININTAQALGTISLCIILFSGGMDTKITDIRPVLAPGVTLATIGVMLTAVITAVVIYYVFGWLNALATLAFPTALLIASTMSSTDSASVFSIMRTNGVQLKHNLRPLLELESGANDPMAYIMTITLIGIVTSGQSDIQVLGIIQDILIQLVMGAVMGFAFGKMVVALLTKVRLSNESLYPIMVLTACIFIFAVTYYLKGNPYLAVYIGGLIIGNTKFTKKQHTKSFFDGLTWLAQLVMFLMLGLMVRPTELLEMNVWLPCLIISIVMILIARPISVVLCMQPFKRYKISDKLLLSWVGLKGAVPIIFAILCVANKVPHASMLFNVVFACTLVSLVVQGASLSKVARKLNLAMPGEEEHHFQYFDIDLPEEIQAMASEMEVTEEMVQNGKLLKNLVLDDRIRVVMARRGEHFFVPNGKTEMEVSDHLLVIEEERANKAHQQAMDDDEAEDKIAMIRMIKHTKSMIGDVYRKMRGLDMKPVREEKD